MFKKILLVLLLIGVIGGGYVYYDSLQRPDDTYVASDAIIEVTNNNSNPVAQPETNSGTEVSEVSTDLTEYQVVANSVIGRKATKPTGFHTGTVSVKGKLVVDSQLKSVVAGLFVIDMPSIKLLDTDNPKLESEIRDDFFEATTYPVSTFILKSIEPMGSGMMAYGDLMIKDQTRLISFPIQMTMSDDMINVKASFAIDRLLRGLTMWEGKANNFIEYMIDMNFEPVSQ